jgi:hypothetical protein
MIEMYRVASEVTQRSTESFTARCQTRSGAPRRRERWRGKKGSEGIVSLVLAVFVFCGSCIKVRASYGHVLVTMSTPELNTTVRVPLGYHVKSFLLERTVALSDAISLTTGAQFRVLSRQFYRPGPVVEQPVNCAL